MEKWQRVILHADLNSFYANVECLYRPALWHRPVVVCGDPQSRRGIILAKNEPAKRFGIKTGEAIWQARAKCPGLVCLKADYPRYLQYSRLMRGLLGEYSDQVEPFGLDEAWIDVSGSVGIFGDGPAMADQIRRRVHRELGLYCSVGVSFNKIFAKLGSDMQKPNATTIISPRDYRHKVWPLPVQELLYVGPSTRRKLARIGVRTIGGLAAMEIEDLRGLFGKWGETLWYFANGRDIEPVRQTDARSQIKSIGNSTTTPRDLEKETDVKIIFYVLSESVAARLRTYGFRCRTVQIYMRDNRLRSWERQGKLPAASNLASEICRRALELFRENYDWSRPIRSLGVRACDLVTAAEGIQLSLLCDENLRDRYAALEQAIDEIRGRFGYFSIQRGLYLADRPLSGFNPKEEHIIHPVSYMR